MPPIVGGGECRCRLRVSILSRMAGLFERIEGVIALISYEEIEL